MDSYLPDVNVLIALSDRRHTGHGAATKWFRQSRSSEFLLCPITESGFVRVSTLPQGLARSFNESIMLLEEIARLPNYRYLPIQESWRQIVQPFVSRLYGYRQVTDAYLLGLAIHHNAILVTLDQRIEAIAGPKYQHSLLTLVP